MTGTAVPRVTREGPGLIPTRATVGGMPRPGPDLLTRAASVLLWLEAVAFAALAAGAAVHFAQVGTADGGAALGIAACAVLGAASVALIARGFSRGSSWSYGAALTWQLLQVAIATLIWRALPVAAAVIVVVSGVVAIAVTRRGAAAASAETDEGR